ncbi:DUF2142 domain-containing protein [Nocardioides sp.]|uniref:DUF2142 domain-containing protein n=1 Tax=Nocardioides sp. TaxID=35761 RepID=UPI0035615A9A
MKSRQRIAVAMFGALLCAQAAWILAVPPFRGIDEFDHAFRAAGVADGQWRLTQPAERGRGLLVEVPAEMVEASRAQCESLSYIETQTCAGDGPGQRDGTVLATTSAAGYEPIYYWLVGTAAKPFSGAHALYAMRAASALMCALVIALAMWCLGAWLRGPWAYVGALVGLTPMLIYSTTVVAPNGLEMAAGLCLWTSLLGLGIRGGAADGPEDLRRERGLLAAATFAAVVMAGLRDLGPLWVLLIVICVVVLRGPRSSWAVCRRHRLQVALGVLLSVGSALALLAWKRGGVPVPQGLLNADVDSSWTQAVRYPDWIVGTVGAFPFRDQPAPIAVHVLVLAVLMAMLVAVVRHAAQRERLVVYLAVAFSLLVPSLLVWVTLEEKGGIWQGRYSLPFTVGVMVLVGLVLDSARWRVGPRDHRAQLLVIGLLATAHIVSVVSVERLELARDVSTADPNWWHLPPALTALTMAAGWLLVAWGLVAARRLAATASSGETRDTTAEPHLVDEASAS